MLRTSVVLKEAPARKQYKSRITIVVGANADGSKFPLLFLGKAHRPHSLHDKPDNVLYEGTSRGWMKVPVYNKWLRLPNERMRNEERQVLLLVDNALVHIERELQLTNITLRKLPPNTTSLLQPVDQGVIADLKWRFISLSTEAAVGHYLEDFSDPHCVSMLEGIEWCAESWEAMSRDIICNCWGHSGLVVSRMSITSLLNQ